MWSFLFLQRYRWAHISPIWIITALTIRITIRWFKCNEKHLSRISWKDIIFLQENKFHLLTKQTFTDLGSEVWIVRLSQNKASKCVSCLSLKCWRNGQINCLFFFFLTKYVFLLWKCRCYIVLLKTMKFYILPSTENLISDSFHCLLYGWL